jgi:putative endonuclease
MANQTTTKIGKQGEDLAKQYLEGQGMRFVMANWSSRLGEIDLIMQDKSTRVFVEVRRRRSTSFGEGLETVARQKQQKLIRTAKLYQQQTNYWGDARFDVISIIQDPHSAPRIAHVESAFDLTT